MGRVGGIRIILTVAGIAFCRGILKVSRGMTAAAILDVVPAGEREEGMAESRPAPGLGVQFMAEGTLGAEVPLHVVGVGCCLVIGHVAIHAFHSQGFEPEQGGGRMAGRAFGRVMGAAKGKTANMSSFSRPKSKKAGKYMPRTSTKEDQFRQSFSSSRMMPTNWSANLPKSARFMKVWMKSLG